MSQRFKGFSGKVARKVLGLVSTALLVAGAVLVFKGFSQLEGVTGIVFVFSGLVALVFSLIVLALALSNLFDTCSCGHWRWGHGAVSHAAGPPPLIVRWGVCGKAVCLCLDFKGVPRGA